MLSVLYNMSDLPASTEAKTILIRDFSNHASQMLSRLLGQLTRF